MGITFHTIPQFGCVCSRLHTAIRHTDGRKWSGEHGQMLTPWTLIKSLPPPVLSSGRTQSAGQPHVCIQIATLGCIFHINNANYLKLETARCSEKGPNCPTCHSIPAAQRHGCGRHLPCRIWEKSLRGMGAARTCIRGPCFHPDLCMWHIIAYSCINTHTHTGRVYQLA